MAFLGKLALGLALLLALYSIWANWLGMRRNRAELLASARHALWAMAAMVALAAGTLWAALLQSDFSLEYVASYTSTTLPTVYKVTALWGGQQGSLLFWTLLLSLFTALVAFQNRARNSEIAPWVLIVMAGVAVFFLGMLNFITRPFDPLIPAAAQGRDLNPLLQNYWMAIHPPSLYTGYVSATVPFAFACAALITRRLDDNWIRSTRRWAIFSWFFLTLGNMFGARWAYEVLGWGGYWAWDPVENAAFMPWLVMTAYLHSVMVQERKDMLKVWNLVLIGMAFALTLFGTFITRSGVISSVHSFTQSGLGPYFLGFLLVVVVSYTALLVSRLPALRSPAEIESFLSREAAFLFNNLVLVGIAFAVFWGTIFPVLSEAVRGVKITVGPPFFNKVNGPLALALIFLMGVGPLIAWRRASRKNLVQSFTAPMVFGLGIGLLSLALGIHIWYVLVAFSLAAFALATVVMEFQRGVGARGRMVHEPPPRALANLIAKNNRRYGGYIVHVGVALAFVGIVGSSFFKTEVKRSVNQGQSFAVGPYQLTYQGLSSFENAHMERLTANLALSRNGRALATLTPAKLFYKREQQPATQVAIRPTLAADLYVVLAGVDDKSSMATFEVFLTPLVSWLWLGGLMMALGTVVAMWPNLREREAIAAALSHAHGVQSAAELV
ncbi:MAG TPA: heme lyase CcmF/NrfE family subunit, partial [Candidatus Binataceae bacterium]|nr:heme lyase CcmF/NrfE family subunit [Candidatus Binataceae bacterium]